MPDILAGRCNQPRNNSGCPVPHTHENHDQLCGSFISPLRKKCRCREVMRDRDNHQTQAWHNIFDTPLAEDALSRRAAQLRLRSFPCEHHRPPMHVTVVTPVSTICMRSFGQHRPAMGLLLARGVIQNGIQYAANLFCRACHSFVSSAASVFSGTLASPRRSYGWIRGVKDGGLIHGRTNRFYGST